MKITAHAIVKNEVRFVWYSIMSIINFVDKILIYDTASTDGTKEILKLIKNKHKDKVILKFIDEVTVDSYSSVIQQMLDETKTDWIFVIDADEIWWEDSIKKVYNEIQRNGQTLESIVVPTINLVGDIYHKQEDKAGLYKLAGRKGHLNLRAVNKNIPGLVSCGPHGQWSWRDEDGRAIQDRDQSKIKFVNAPYLHATFLQRSSSKEGDSRVPKRAKKRKHEIGDALPKDFYYPEVFFRERPSIVPNVWEKMNKSFLAQSLVETPFRKLKRRLLPVKQGY